MSQRRFSDITIFLIVFAVSATFFILKSYGSMMLFSATIAYIVMASMSLFAAMHSRSDEDYYRNLYFNGLIYTLTATIIMIAISLFFAQVMARSFQSVLYYPSMSELLATASGASAFTCILAEFVYQFSIVATGEELLKFAVYTEIKARYKSMALAILIAVGFWAGFHAIQAYRNILNIIPAFICGLIMVWLLEYTHSFLAPLIAHGAYNTFTFIINSWPSLAKTYPLFPVGLTTDDLFIIGLAALWLAFILLPILFRKR